MNVWVKRIGYVIGALIALILVVVSVVYGMSESRFPQQGSTTAGLLMLPCCQAALRS